MSGRQAFRLWVTGRVQGVGFRWATRAAAREIGGLTGKVRNLPDGRVEVVAHGTPEALDALERWLWQGPPAAKGEGVERAPLDGEPPRSFTTG